MRKRKRARQPKAEQAASIEPPLASFPLVGSDVLDVVGSRGAAKREMHDVIHAPDDGIAEVALGPHEGASVSFRPDPTIGDAGADFAEEFGGNYLRSATTGEDMSELENPPEGDATEIAGPFVIETPPPEPAHIRRRHSSHASRARGARGAASRAGKPGRSA
jgi:hypothetical protein